MSDMKSKGTMELLTPIICSDDGCCLVRNNTSPKGQCQSDQVLGMWKTSSCVSEFPIIPFPSYNS